MLDPFIDSPEAVLKGQLNVVHVLVQNDSQSPSVVPFMATGVDRTGRAAAGTAGAPVGALSRVTFVARFGPRRSAPSQLPAFGARPPSAALRVMAAPLPALGAAGALAPVRGAVPVAVASGV